MNGKSLSERCGDFFPSLDKAVEVLRASGFYAEANALNTVAHYVAYTTSSEMTGEIGKKIRELQRSLGSRIPAQAAASLEEALSEIRKIWPRI